MPSLSRLAADHVELRALCAELRGLTASASPPDREVLTDARWRLARCLLRHLPLKDRLVYARLRCHPNPAVVDVVERFSAETGQLYGQFASHSERWTPEAVEKGWASYSIALRTLTHLLEDRLAREEAELLPHLDGAPDIPTTRGLDDRNWAADGWAIRDRLGVDKGTPRAA